MPTREQVLKYQATRNVKRRERYANDPAYRAKRLAGKRDPTPEQVANYRVARNARRRERYANDPDYRAARLAESKSQTVQDRQNARAYQAMIAKHTTDFI